MTQVPPMIKGELQPEPIRFYTTPVPANLKYSQIHKDPFPEPQEAQVWFPLNGKRKTAFVPLDIVDEVNQTVTATLVGECQGKIVVSFPPTNFGRTRFSASETELAPIISETSPDGG